MKIEILGTGCAKCTALEEVAKQAILKTDGSHSVEKVEDVMKIMQYNVISTPALVIDGNVKSTGKLLTVDEVLELIKKNS